jgi:hypothetical protein
VAVHSDRCLGCMAIFTAEGGWRPVEDGSRPAREHRFRGSLVTRAFFCFYIALIVATAYLEHLDRPQAETWGGFMSFMVKIFVGLPTSVLVWANCSGWCSAAATFWGPIALNFLFFAWLAFPLRKSKTAA